MLEVLTGRELSDVVAVVTRYFGGVLLGAGGLVRAYSDAVRAALEEAGVRERRLSVSYDVEAGHAEAARLENELRSRGVTVLGVDYAQRVLLHVAVPAEEAAGFGDLLAALTGGAATARPAGEDWVDC
jgi:putative IMPACT (imprinted ancient) family translation regulator